MVKTNKTLTIFILFLIISLSLITISHANSNELQSNQYKIVHQNNSNYIIGIVAGTTTSELQNNINNENIEFYSESNVLLKKFDIIKTGMYIKFNGIKYNLVVSGDVNGDGIANQTDLFKIRSHIVGLTKLSNEYLFASNVNVDNKTSSTDILKLKQDIVHLINIKDLYQQSKTNTQFEYTINKLTNTIKLNKYIDVYTSNISIPDNIYDIPVVEISNSLLLENSVIKNICFSKNITKFPIELLQNCKTLENISVDTLNSNYQVSDGILYNKNVTSLIYFPVAKKLDYFVIPSTVHTIGKRAFANVSNVNNMFLPNSLSNIDETFFENCNSKIYIRSDFPLIDFIKSKGISYIIDTPPIVEQITKTEEVRKSVTINFIAKDDFGIINWAITKQR